MGTTGESNNRGANLVVVALPSKDDYIWKISSEKVPHLTLLFLGENKLGDQTSHVVDYIQHAVSTSLDRFGLSVDRRGELGEDKADVLFFEKAYAKNLEQFRSHLLANRSIAEAYHSAEQFPTWTPHLTLGYPASPAKPDTRDYPGISWVNFDRIALWTSDSDGPTFELTSNDRLEEVSMSQVQPNAVAEFLEHHGVKGMKWGVRRDSKTGIRPIAKTLDESRFGRASKANADRHDARKAARTEKKSAKISAKTDRQVKRADKRWDRSVSGLGGYLKVYNAAADQMNRTEIARINNKPEYKGVDMRKKGPVQDKYFKEYATTFTRVLNAQSKAIHGTNASGTKKVVFHQDEALGFPTARVVDVKVKHADDSVEIQMKFDTLGHILEFNFPDAMAQGEELATEVLAHFGVKGMRWGFRKDGVSTSRKAAGSKESPDSKKAAAAKAKVGRKGNTKALSNDELQSLVKRMNLEKQYRNLSGEKSTAPVPAKLALSGAKFTSKFVSDVGTGIAKQQATRVGNDFATTYVNDLLKKTMKK